MKRMIYDIPLATIGMYLNADKVKVGYWNNFSGKFEEDLPVYEGAMGDLQFATNKRSPEVYQMWCDMKMRKINHIAAENDVLVIGVDRYDYNV